MTRIGRFWEGVANADGSASVVCNVCPRECRLRDGQRGFCYSRRNHGGAIEVGGYGHVIGMCADPIEKKPLNHFYPGTGVFSFGTAGCNLGCKFCQNWSMSKAKSMDRASRYVPPEQIPDLAIASGCASVAFTYNDPTIFVEYAIDVAVACREAGIRTVVVSAGYINPEARTELYEHIDAANIDLKAFTQRFYRKLCLGDLAPVLDTLVYLGRQADVWLEITNLLIPGENDADEEIAAMSEWLVTHLGPDVPLHFTAFHPDFRMRDRPATSPATLAAARRIARDAGLRHVYVGNVHDADAGSTYCAGCGQLLIERDWYRLGAYNLDGNLCNACGLELPGRFSDAGVADFGPHRLPLSFSRGEN